MKKAGRFFLIFLISAILFFSCKKKEPEPFEYSKTLGYGFNYYTKLFESPNVLYSFDIFTDYGTWGEVDKVTGEKTSKFFLNVSKPDITFDSTNLYFIRRDSLFSFNKTNEQEGFIDKLNLLSQNIDTIPLFCDNNNLYYLKYEVISGLMNFNLYQWNPNIQTKILMFSFFPRPKNFTHDDENVYVSAVSSSPQNILIKINKNTFTQTILLESTKSIQLVTVKNNQLIYKVGSSWGKTNASSVNFHNNSNNVISSGYFWNNDYIYFMDNLSYSPSLGMSLCKQNVINGEKKYIASSLHGISKILLAGSSGIYVLDESGCIGLINY